METVNRWGLLLLLPILGAGDLKDGWIDGRLLLFPALCGALQTLEAGGEMRRLAAFLPGALLLLASVLTREAVGEGDALLIWSLGFVLPAEECLLIACIALWAGGALGLVRCLRKGLREQPLRERLRQERIALAPVIAAVSALVAGPQIP